jgi:hypothetical protein
MYKSIVAELTITYSCDGPISTNLSFYLSYASVDLVLKSIVAIPSDVIFMTLSALGNYGVFQR